MIPRIPRAGWARVLTTAAAAGALTAALTPGAAEAAGPVETAEWALDCDTVATAYDDPILMPGRPGQWHHLHTFGGNPSVNASSTAHQLYADNTNPGCTNSADASSYWQPTLLDAAGQPMQVTGFRIYYRGNWADDPADIQPIPFGLRMVAGDARATTPAEGRDIGFFCIEDRAYQVVSNGYETRDCGPGAFLRTHVTFPSCWDGTNLDSPDHVSHVAYPRGGTCPASHPEPIPAVAVEASYEGQRSSRNMRFEGGLSQYGLHADFINAWDPGEMRTLVDGCIRAQVNCGDATDTRRVFDGPERYGTIPLPAEDPTPTAADSGSGHAGHGTSPAAPTGPEGTAQRRAGTQTEAGSMWSSVVRWFTGD